MRANAVIIIVMGVALVACSSPSLNASGAPGSQLAVDRSGATPVREGSLLRVVGSSLMLAATPREGAAILGRLARGGTLYVLSPTEDDLASGWVPVAVAAGEFASVDCGAPCGSIPIGWMALIDLDDGSVVEADVDCPSQPIESDELMGMAPLVVLHCFGDTELILVDVVSVPTGFHELTPSYLLEPYWLAFTFGPYIGDTGPVLHFDPSTHPVLPVMNSGDPVKVVGSFDSPVSETCVAKTFPAGDDQDEIPELRDFAVLQCRTQFVVREFMVGPGPGS